jgi:large subunit ribosomal protein L6
VTVNGPKGALKQQFDPDMQIEIENNAGQGAAPDRPARTPRPAWADARAAQQHGARVSRQGSAAALRLSGVGYQAQRSGATTWCLSVGKSHTVEIVPPSKDIAFEVDKDGRGFTISGIDKARSASWPPTIRRTRPPEPYRARAFATPENMCAKRQARLARPVRSKGVKPWQK